MAQMKGSMDRQTFSTLLGNAELLAWENGVYTIGMTNGFTRDWAEQRLSGTIEQILSGMHGEPQKVSFVVSGNWQPSPAERETAEETPVTEAAPAAPQAVPAVQKHTGNILSRFTFDNFVVSGNNNLAAAAARAVAETPGTAYNPLFIYGGVGMGKTHLLHAIGNRLKDSDLNVVFVSSEEFTADFIRSIQNRDDESFREKFFDDAIAHTINIHRIARREMNHALDFSGATFWIKAIMEAFDLGQCFPADWAIIRHNPRNLGAISPRNNRPRDFRNDVRGFVQTNNIADHQALFFDEILVVEGCSLHR